MKTIEKCRANIFLSFPLTQWDICPRLCFDTPTVCPFEHITLWPQWTRLLDIKDLKTGTIFPSFSYSAWVSGSVTKFFLSSLNEWIFQIIAFQKNDERNESGLLEEKFDLIEASMKAFKICSLIYFIEITNVDFLKLLKVVLLVSSHDTLQCLWGYWQSNHFPVKFFLPGTWFLPPTFSHCTVVLAPTLYISPVLSSVLYPLASHASRFE